MMQCQHSSLADRTHLPHVLCRDDEDDVEIYLTCCTHELNHTVTLKPQCIRPLELVVYYMCISIAVTVFTSSINVIAVTNPRYVRVNYCMTRGRDSSRSQQYSKLHLSGALPNGFAVAPH